MRCGVTGKLRHPDEVAAELVAREQPHDHRVHPYPCPHCGGWHLGGHHRRREGDVLAQFGVGELAVGGTTIGERLKGRP